MRDVSFYFYSPVSQRSNPSSLRKMMPIAIGAIYFMKKA